MKEGNSPKHSDIKEYCLNHILPSVFVDFKEKLLELDTIHVIVGGIALEHCVSKHKKLYQLINDYAPTEDIDIKLIVQKNIRTNYLLVCKLQAEIMSKCFEKLQVQYKQTNIKFYLEQISSIQKLGIHNSYNNLMTIMLNIGGNTNSLLDVMVASVDVYKDLLCMLKVVSVPYKTKNNGLNFAICKFVYFDSLRMLRIKLKQLRKTQNMFSFFKLYRYIIKFYTIHNLLVQNKKTKALLGEEFSHVIAHAKKELSTIYRTYKTIDRKVLINSHITYDLDMLDDINEKVRSVFTLLDPSSLRTFKDCSK